MSFIMADPTMTYAKWLNRFSLENGDLRST